jgi:hypothetical protein
MVPVLMEGEFIKYTQFLSLALGIGVWVLLTHVCFDSDMLDEHPGTVAAGFEPFRPRQYQS